MNRRQLLVGAGASVLGCAARPRAPATQRTVIVGAGISGLAIAHELGKRGEDVLVLEATARPGGRIRTVRGFRDDLYVEAGAQHLISDPHLLALIDELGVALVERPRSPPLARVSWLRGARHVTPPGGPAPEDPTTMTAEEAALGLDGRLARYIAPAATLDPDATAWPAEVGRLDHLTAADWLRGQERRPVSSVSSTRCWAPAIAASSRCRRSRW